MRHLRSNEWAGRASSLQASTRVVRSTRRCLVVWRSAPSSRSRRSTGPPSSVGNSSARSGSASRERWLASRRRSRGGTTSISRPSEARCLPCSCIGTMAANRSSNLKTSSSNTSRPSWQVSAAHRLATGRHQRRRSHPHHPRSTSSPGHAELPPQPHRRRGAGLRRTDRGASRVVSERRPPARTLPPRPGLGRRISRPPHPPPLTTRSGVRRPSSGSPPLPHDLRPLGVMADASSLDEIWIEDVGRSRRVGAVGVLDKLSAKREVNCEGGMI